MQATREIHLVQDRAPVGPVRHGRLRRPHAAPLPASILRLEDGLAGLALQPGPRLVTHRDHAAASYWLQPLFHARAQPRLLLTCARDAPLRPLAGGTPALLVQALGIGEHLCFVEVGLTFRVELFCRPHIGPPTPAMIGGVCPACRAAITPDRPTRIYACPMCQTILHLETSAQGDPDPRTCAQAYTACPGCQQPMLFSGPQYINYAQGGGLS